MELGPELVVRSHNGPLFMGVVQAEGMTEFMGSNLYEVDVS